MTSINHKNDNSGLNLTREHWRLLYLISLYSAPSSSKDQKERWIRKLSLQVFMYQGIISDVFDWDYSPVSVPFLDSRLYLNISQEGEDDICDLRELKLVNSMRISTVKHRFIEVLQVSEKALEVLHNISDQDRHSVEALIECPQCGSRLLAEAYECEAETDQGNLGKDDVYQAARSGLKHDYITDSTEDYQEDCCLIKCRDCDYTKVSGITDIEDVSYVSSPYIPNHICPDCKSASGQTHLDFHNAEPGNGSTNIKDRLDELIILGKVKLVISEWIPFGTNHIESMSSKLGASERVKNSMFTQVIDHDPGGTELSIMPGLTQVFVRDSRPGQSVSFDASIYYPEDPGIVQIEEFGVNASAMGRILLGLDVKSVASYNEDRVSLDHLARLLSDVVLDSSDMLNTLLTSYQRNLLSLVFMGKPQNRDKYALVICEDIDPLKKVEDYLDAEGFECELKQILEEVVSVKELSDNDFIILGTHGTLLKTKNPSKYDLVTTDFIGIKAMEIFMQNFFSTQFVLNDVLRDIKVLIEKSETDPRAIETVQSLLSKATGNSTLMREIQGYLQEAIEIFDQKTEENNSDYEEDVRELAEFLKIRDSIDTLRNRINDMEKIISGTLKSLEGLAAVTDVIAERQMHRVQEALQNNTRNLEDVTRSSERTGVTMEIMEVILAGSLAFDIMDRITGEWSVMSSPDAGTWGADYLGPLINIPGVWFGLSMGLWAVIAFGLYRFMNWLQEKSEPVLIARVKVNRPCNVLALNNYLNEKNITIRDVDDYEDTLRKKVTWSEKNEKKWGASEVRIELFFDEKNGFVLSYLLEVPEPDGVTTEKVSRIFEEELSAQEVFF